MFRNFQCGVQRVGDALQSILLLAIRLFWGYAFFLSGYGKLINIEATAKFFTKIAIPFPLANAYIAGSIECFGGLLLIFGLFSRIAAIPLIIVMIVAYLTAHHEAIVNPALFVSEAPFNFLLASLLIFAFGPGKISLDYLLCKLFFQNKSDAMQCDENNKCNSNNDRDPIGKL